MTLGAPCVRPTIRLPRHFGVREQRNPLAHVPGGLVGSSPSRSSYVIPYPIMRRQLQDFILHPLASNSLWFSRRRFSKSRSRVPRSPTSPFGALRINAEGRLKEQRRTEARELEAFKTRAAAEVKAKLVTSPPDFVGATRREAFVPGPEKSGPPKGGSLELRSLKRVPPADPSGRSHPSPLPSHKKVPTLALPLLPLSPVPKGGKSAPRPITPPTDLDSPRRRRGGSRRAKQKLRRQWEWVEIILS